MSSLICGSVAFDTITHFPGRFAQQILPEQVHILNVSFLVPTLRREFGGCAGNIAYTLKLLGGSPVIAAAIGGDGQEYLDRLRAMGIDVSLVRVCADAHTAQAIIITDAGNNQITAFHPGAMQQSHLVEVPTRADLKLGIIGPDGRDAMLRRAEQFGAAGIPFVFDPGQGLPMFDGAELSRFVSLAGWVTVNDYEGRMLCDRIGSDFATLSRSHLQGIVVTLAEHGCDVWVQGECTHVAGVAATEVVDPTGCGDAFRAALLYGLEQGWTLTRCAELGNRMGAIKIASQGGQNHSIDRVALGLV